MKKITLMAMMLMTGLYSHAQMSNETVTDYGRIWNINYDLETEGKMYGQSLNNHIVVSYDNGATWDLQYSFPNSGGQIDNLKALSSETLCFTIQNVGEGNGIYFYSIEDGEITNIIPLPGGENVGKFDVYGDDGSTILAVTDGGNKVYYTTTSGENWDLIYDYADYNDVSVWNVAIDPENPAKIFIVRGPGPSDVDGGLFISEDSGETFTEELAGIELMSIGINPFNTDDMIAGALDTMADEDKMYRSTDGGANWEAIPIDWSEDDYHTVLFVKFHPTIEGTIFALEDNEIVSTDDNGDSWTVTVYDDITQYNYGMSLSLNPADGKEAAISTNYYPVLTTDGGVTVTQIKNPYPRVDRVSITEFDGNEHLYYMVEGGFVHKNYETNSSDAYDIMDPGMIGGSETQMVADHTVEGRVFTYVGGFMGKTLSVSTDHGATKTTIFNDFAPNLLNVIVDPANANIVYVLLDNFDQGMLYKLDITDVNNVQNTPITLPDDGANAPLRDLIVFSGETANELYIAKGTRIYKSVNDGTEWTELYVTEDFDINDIAVNSFDANEWAIATEGGVFTTTDKGVNWTLATEATAANIIKFSNVQDGIIVAGVYNSEGASFITYFNGESWMSVQPDDIEYAHSYTMDFTFEEGEVTAYIGTVDIGVLRYVFDIEETAGTPDIISQKLSIFPNPSSGIVTVIAGNEAVTKAELYSITGQKIMETVSGTIDISALSSGIYIIKAETTNGKSLTAKVVRK